MTAALWPIAVVAIAVLATYVSLTLIRARAAIQEARVAKIEAELAGLSATGKVLANHETRLATLQRALKEYIAEP